ncbi:DNA primase [Stenoxybacter acetivorans]|uniref:DNA primase n=1 Tax=Stenoxybacter acetivorans TaxID=422441 RepID=UPI000560BD42|nr:DNA primase [Stenoxybacter acetivorans]
MIPNEFIDELLSKTDIVDVIDAFVPLKKGGQNYMACCPFHKEKSPSFSVSPHKQFYHCFGCGAHGSAIGFIMEYQGLSFTDAVRFLADRVGLTLPQAVRRQNPEAAQARKKAQQTLEETTAAAAVFYQQQLAQSAQAQHYLQRRGLNEEIIEQYQLGYAPDDWQALSHPFQPYPSQALIDSGLVLEKDGRHYDRFRGRIMFPIRNQRGQVLGFGARVLDKGEPKYLNSPETPLFDKGRNLYGLYEARATIKSAERVLVVEGYMDVAALAQFGVGYAVASLGTSVTADHIQLLMRQSDNVYFCFDGDAAGRKAARRTVENVLPQLKDDKKLFFLFLPSQHDPDSFIREHGKAVFEDALLNQSLALSAYFWQTLSENLDLNRQEDKAALIKSSATWLAQIQAPALSFLLRQQLSQMVGVDDHQLAGLLGQEVPQKAVRVKRYRLPETSFRQPKMHSLAEIQLRALLINPQWAVYTDLPEYLNLSGDYACLAAVAERIRASITPLSSGAVWELMRHTEFAPTIQRVLQNSAADLARYVQEDADENKQREQEEAACENFKQGMQKIHDQLKNEQIQALTQKHCQLGLNDDEKKLLLRLISASKNTINQSSELSK